MSKNTAKRNDGPDRRTTKRRPVLATFSLFVVVPKKGVHRLKVNDLSEQGLGFEFDTEGEDPAMVELKESENLEVRFYFNQSLFVVLRADVMRISDREGIRQIGAKFTDLTSKNYKAFRSFVDMLDQIIDVAEVEASTGTT